MKMVVSLFLLLALCVRGWTSEWSGSWTTSNDLVPTLSATETVSRPRPEKASVGTAGVTQLPERLPIENEMEMLNHASSVKFYMQVYIALAFKSQISGNWLQNTMTKNMTGGGYSNYVELLLDVQSATDMSLIKVSGSTNYSGEDLSVVLMVTYLEAGQIHPVGIWMTRHLGLPASKLDSGKIREAFSYLTPDDTLQSVVRVQGLSMFKIESVTPSGIATYEWTSSGGATKANWLAGHRDDTVQDYVVLNRWFCSYRTRIRFEIGSQSATYTQFGDKLSPPTLEIDRNTSSLKVHAPRGADITVFSSTNLNNQIQNAILQSVERTTVLSINLKQGNTYFNATAE